MRFQLSGNRIAKKWILSVILLIGVVLGGYGLLTAWGAFLIEADSLQPVDAIIVLSGGSDKRLEEAAALIKERYASALIITETGEMLGKYGAASREMYLDAVALGVSPVIIYKTEVKVSSTYDEAEATLQRVRPLGVRSVIIVTDPYHSRRTQAIFRKVYADSGVQVFVRPARDHWYRSNTWFTRLEGWTLTISESFKLLLFYLGIRLD